MPTKLKIWNGRGHGREYDRGHFYVCATSRREAARLLCRAAYPNTEVRDRMVDSMDREIRVYYAEDCWGDSMKGIAPSPGVWATKGFSDKPVKLI